MTQEFLEKRMLSRVNAKFDKRQGSIIYDATAPASFELAEAYIMARVILRETFATTASREYLIMRAAEFNVYPEEATFAEVKGIFNREVPIGSRFNYEKYNFIVKELINDESHEYKLQCETAGVGGNGCIGNILPITDISNLTTAQITEIITPGEDEEDTEIFRARYIAALKTIAYGGNGADYKQKALAVNGVGGVKVYRCRYGGGTVGLTILNTEYDVPTEEMVKEVHDVFDPDESGKGYGLAPIGHVVTVTGATAVKLAISATVSLKQGTTIGQVQIPIENAVKEYLKSLRIEWTKQTEKEFISVRAAFILSKILEVPNVIDVIGVRINGLERVELATDAVPTFGSINITEG